MPGDGLLHPVVLAALVALVLNDQVLKAAWPGLVTGKLSDVAGLVLAPLVLQAAWELGRWLVGHAWGPSRWALIGAVALVGIGFAGAKTLEPMADFYRVGLGLFQWPFAALASLIGSGAVVGPSPVAFARDPWDLIALPALALPLILGQRRVDQAQANSADEDDPDGHRG